MLNNSCASDMSKIYKNENISKFIQDHIYSLLNNAKLKEVIERVSLQENISREKALKSLLEKMANEIDITAKKNYSNIHIV